MGLNLPCLSFLSGHLEKKRKRKRTKKIMNSQPGMLDISPGSVSSDSGPKLVVSVV